MDLYRVDKIIFLLSDSVNVTIPATSCTEQLINQNTGVLANKQQRQNYYNNDKDITIDNHSYYPRALFVVKGVVGSKNK